MKSILAGLSIIADSIDFRKPEIVPFVLAGNFDDDLLQAFYYVEHGNAATGNEYKTDNRSNFALSTLKDVIRTKINMVLRQLEAVERQNMENIRQELRNSNTPHEMGTVDEIAKKFGISKSEVRRRKAAGTLHELQ